MSFVNGEDVRGGSFQATGRDVGSFQVGHSAPTPLGPEHNWHYFHPGRVDILRAPEWFMRDIKEIDPRLEVVWHPVKQRWSVWCRDPFITFPMCAGWHMIFPWDYEGTYLPLDNRLLSMIYMRSPRVWGNAKKYWQRIEDEVIGDRKRRDKARADLTADMASDYWNYRQIKNIGSGSKFAESHS